MMSITFTVTAKDAWKPRWKRWTRSSLRLTFRLCALPVAAYYLCRFFVLGDPLTPITISVIGIVPFAAAVLALLDLARKAAEVQAATHAIWVAELGEHDFRLGLLQSDGYYYHWTRVQMMDDAADCLFFILTNGTRLAIPKSAFPDPAACQAFFTEALDRWEAALLRESRLIMPHDETVWPPPPRPGA